ncbi:MAG: hypothetical protein WC234_04525 [Endomicrobiaceae bacterium]
MFFLAGLITALIGGITTAATATTAAVTTGLATSLITIGGVSITAGKLIALASVASAFGISKQLLDDVETYHDEYISDSQKDHEKEKLQSKLKAEKQILKTQYSLTDLSSIEELEQNNEYFKALALISQIKLKKAEELSNQKIADEAQEVLTLLKQVRQESKQLN